VTLSKLDDASNLQLHHELPLADERSQLNWPMGEMTSLLVRWTEVMHEQCGRDLAP
jgi:hypothetical protein